MCHALRVRIPLKSTTPPAKPINNSATTASPSEPRKNKRNEFDSNGFLLKSIHQKKQKNVALFGASASKHPSTSSFLPVAPRNPLIESINAIAARHSTTETNFSAGKLSPKIPSVVYKSRYLPHSCTVTQKKQLSSTLMPSGLFTICARYSFDMVKKSHASFQP